MSSIVTYVPRPQPTLGNDQLYLQQELAAISGAGKTLTNQVNTNTTDIASLKASRTTDEANIASLQSSRTTDEANISSLLASRTTDEATLTAMQAAWTAYTPTISSTAGTLGSTSGLAGRYIKIGKTVHFQCSFNIVTVGTASGFLLVGLPAQAGPGSAYHVSGRENALVGYMYNGYIPASANAFYVMRYDNASPIVAGYQFTMGGSYEAA